MSTFNLEKYEEVAKPPATSNIPAPVADQPITQNTDSTATNDSTVTITGPLSNVYAKALMLVYGEGSTLGTESSAMDTTMLVIKDTQDNPAPKESSTLFVSDQENVEENPVETFQKLHLALDNKKNPNASKYVVLENISNVNAKTAIILDYARANATKVFYNRNSFLNYMKR
jgi:hypothetical protein